MHCQPSPSKADVVLELSQDYQLKNIEQMLVSGRESMAAELCCQWIVYILSRKQEFQVCETMTKMAFKFSLCVVGVPKAQEHAGQLMLVLISRSTIILFPHTWLLLEL